MKLFIQVLTIFIGLLLMHCATIPPEWKHYKKAIKCHMQAKGTECNRHYEKAIKIKKSLPGVHASYGAHLYSLGQASDAKQQFEIEAKTHPEINQTVRIGLDISETGTTPTTKTIKEKKEETPKNEKEQEAK